MFGDIIATLDRPGVAEGVMMTLDSDLIEKIERRAAAASMTPAEFAAGTVREFVDRGDDDLWFQLLTVMRKADDPGLAAIQAVLKWVVNLDE